MALMTHRWPGVKVSIAIRGPVHEWNGMEGSFLFSTNPPTQFVFEKLVKIL